MNVVFNPRKIYVTKADRVLSLNLPCNISIHLDKEHTTRQSPHAFFKNHEQNICRFYYSLEFPSDILITDFKKNICFK